MATDKSRITSLEKRIAALERAQLKKSKCEIMFFRKLIDAVTGVKKKRAKVEKAQIMAQRQICESLAAANSRSRT